MSTRSQSRDFIFVKDTVRASILAMKNRKNRKVFNISTSTYRFRYYISDYEI
ncbi:MAG: NAD-dependent epimerase/dehydratase family protein [Thermoplasmata archaeon]